MGSIQSNRQECSMYSEDSDKFDLQLCKRSVIPWVKIVSFLTVIVLIIVCYPQSSYAWGPATHLSLASSVLNNLQVLPVHIQALIESYPYDFVYGCIGADVIHGKKFIEYAKHCHNWHMGMKVLENARSDSQRSFAYGYLSHLAADVIAHNYYVPNQIIASFSTRTLKHAYWELRFDAYVDKSVWTLADKVAIEVHRDNDPLLRATLDNTLFSFGTNKRIFNSVLMLSRLKKWHVAMDLISKKSRWKLDEKDVESYNKLAVDATFAFLIDGKKAICYKADPAGRKSLETARKIRKELKELRNAGRISERDYPEIFEKLKPSFKEATFREFGHLELKEVIF